MTPAPASQIRRDARHQVGLVDASFRAVGADAWVPTTLRDLSVGGASFSVGADIQAGYTLELVLRRRDTGHELTLGVEVLRILAGDSRAAGVRFVTLTADATRWLIDVLGSTADVADAAGTDVVVPTTAADLVGRGERTEVRYEGPSVETLALSAIRLHDQSLYELLDLDPACADGDLESRAEKLIADVARAVDEAVGRREARLKILHRSLIRMRPLWSNPIKRARYDLRWGYVRAEQRILDARTLSGVHPHILASIWLDLHPDSGLKAEERVNTARTRAEVGEALRAAIELEPFTLKWRQRLAALLRPPTGENADEDGAMPAPGPMGKGQVPTVRGNLDDLPVRSLLLSLSDTDSDIQLELRFLGKQIGQIGVADRQLVVAIAGNERGPAALRRLVDIRTGEFIVRYAPPPSALHHLREPLAEALRAAFS